MEARTVNNLLPAASHDDAVGCLVAIELSKKSWIVAVNTPLSDKISRLTLSPAMGRNSWICASGSGRALPEKRSSAWKSFLATKLATTASGSTACSKQPLPGRDPTRWKESRPARGR